MHEQSYDIYEWMVITVARVGVRLPAIGAALRDAIADLAAAIPLAGDAAASAAPHARRVGRTAFLRVLAIGQELTDARDPGAIDDAIALRAIGGVLDALAPLVGDADRRLSTFVVERPPALMPYAELVISGGGPG